jgi:hypothetical protein
MSLSRQFLTPTSSEQCWTCFRRGRQRQAALGLVGDAIRTRKTSAERIRIALEAASCTKWRRVVLAALPDVAAGAQSPLELRDSQIRRRHGLPAGQRQVRRGGKTIEYLDVLIAPYGVHIELDGRLGHDRATERWRRCRKCPVQLPNGL